MTLPPSSPPPPSHNNEHFFADFLPIVRRGGGRINEFFRLVEAPGWMDLCFGGRGWGGGGDGGLGGRKGKIPSPNIHSQVTFLRDQILQFFLKWKN